MCDLFVKLSNLRGLIMLLGCIEFYNDEDGFYVVVA